MSEKVLHVVSDTKVDPVKSAKEAGLRYTNDVKPGIVRLKIGKVFRYKDQNGKRVTDAKTLKRIKSLVIPPAWKNVWICPIPNGHLQATGIDKRGRKQYRYHPEWRKFRDETKYDRMASFGHFLPLIRNKCDEHLKLPGLPKEKVLATVVKLLEKTLIRVGNEEYAKENDSFGLTTLRDKHVDIHGKKIVFEFKGKSGVEHTISVEDRTLAKIVRNCQDLPGYELFQYVGENGETKDIKSDDVNAYLKEITGENFTAKDFRTWHGTVLAAEALQHFQDFQNKTQAKKNVVRAVEEVSKILGNTKAICRKCYIHPVVINSYLEGKLNETLEHLSKRIAKEIKGELRDLEPGEATVVVFLQQAKRG